MVTVSRVLSRIDMLALDNNLSFPLDVVFIGKYAPGANRYQYPKIKKFNTLGHSAMEWDDGTIYRQYNLFKILGSDGLKFKTDEKIRSEITAYTISNKIPKWPHTKSIFLYKEKIIGVNFGSAP